MSSIVHPFRHGSAERTMFGYRTQDHPGLDRIQNAVSAVAGAIAVVAVVAMVLLTLIDVALRTFAGITLGWSVSFIELYLLPIAAFFGIVVAYRSGAHVAVTSVYQKFNGLGRKLALILGYLVVTVGLVFLFWGGVEGVRFAVSTGEGPIAGSSELVIPGWVMRSIVPVATGLGLILVLLDLFREVTSPWDGPATDYDPGDEASKAIAEAADSHPATTKDGDAS